MFNVRPPRECAPQKKKQKNKNMLYGCMCAMCVSKNSHFRISTFFLQKVTYSLCFTFIFHHSALEGVFPLSTFFPSPFFMYTVTERAVYFKSYLVFFFFCERKMGSFVDPSSYAINLLIAYVEILGFFFFFLYFFFLPPLFS